MITGQDNIIAAVGNNFYTQGIDTMLLKLKNGLYYGGSISGLDTEDEDEAEWGIIFNSNDRLFSAEVSIDEIEGIVEFPIGTIV